MKVHYGIEKVLDCRKPIVTIGTFDGMHLGHQKIIKQLIKAAKDINGETVLITFYPHPRSIINAAEPVKLLQNQNEKIAKLRALGLDHLLVLPFTSEFSKLTAVDFVKTILMAKLNCHSLVLGYDHHFGNNREGNLSFLQAHATKFNLQIIEIPAKEIDAIKISSTKIRNSLIEGEIETANSFLGYPYEINGVIIHGRQLGRTIGFPTANVAVSDINKLIPKSGVYAIKAMILSQTVYGMLNIGINPTFQDSSSLNIEAHLFDYDRDIYGESITLQLITYIRTEQTFNSVNELTKQLKQDEIFVRNYFSNL